MALTRWGFMHVNIYGHVSIHFVVVTYLNSNLQALPNYHFPLDNCKRLALRIYQVLKVRYVIKPAFITMT